MPRARQLGKPLGQPRQPLGLRREVEHVEGQAVAGERAPEHGEVVAQLMLDVGHHPVVGGGRAAQHWHPGGQDVEDGHDAAVVGPEVVAPVADAVGLVDHEQTAARAHHRQDLGTEAGVGEPLG